MRLPEGDFLLLVDASSYFHRAFHAMARLERRVDGMPVNAINGFCWTMMKLFFLEEKTAIERLPSHGAVICDTRGKNFRHDLYPEYKANRGEYHPDLSIQLPWIPRVAEAFDVPCVGLAGYEADDIIATYTAAAERDGLMVVIASSDKDLMQLVSDNVFLYDAMADKDRDRGMGYETTALKDVLAVKEKFGVMPWQMIDMQALVGDVVDNVPGVPKVGPVTAAKLLQRFGDLDRMLDDAEWGGDGFGDRKMADKIYDHRDIIRLSRDLVRLDDNVPLDKTIDDLALRAPSPSKMKALFTELEFPQLVSRVDRR